MDEWAALNAFARVVEFSEWPTECEGCELTAWVVANAEAIEVGLRMLAMAERVNYCSLAHNAGKPPSFPSWFAAANWESRTGNTALEALRALDAPEEEA